MSPLSHWFSHAHQKLRSRLLSDPFYRFQSLEELQFAADLGIRIDVNRATVDDWLRLPGLSIHQARTLVSLSQAGVQFYALEDIAAALGLTPRHLQAFAPVLAFWHYDPESMAHPQRLNPNHALLDALVALPPVDASLATTILAQRRAHGAFKNLADFQQRLHLSAERIAVLMHYLTFN
jgi:DNA uptake protein ComE-like DNA-binding protein